MKRAITFFYLILMAGILPGQILEVTPKYPVTTSEVTIVYDATQGNGRLAGYSGSVYAHAGLITTESRDGSDWKHVIGDWGTADSRVLMQKTGDDRYQISYNITGFYGIGPEEKVLDLAFVFRNEDGSLVGRSADGSDIFYPVNISASGDYVSHQLTGSSLVIETTEGLLSITPYTASIIRLAYAPNGTSPSDTSYTVILEPQNPSFSVTGSEENLLLETGSLRLVIGKFPVTTAFYTNTGHLITSEELGFYNQFNRPGVRLSLAEGEQLGGTGSRAIPVNRRGYRLQNYGQAHYGYGNGTQNLNISVPFVTSSDGYALFFDNHSRGSLDLGGKDANVLDVESESGQMVYYFIEGHTYDKQLERYTMLTGRQPMPPLWSFGYFQSRFGYENEGQARQTVMNMRDGGFPMDVLILDLYWFGDPSTMGNLEWDYSRFPDPVDMIGDFRDMGVKTVLITEPYFTQNSAHYNFISQNKWFGNTPSGNTYLLDNFWAGSASLMDFTTPETLDWMWNFYKARKEEGVAGWWSDLGEPELHPDDMVHKAGRAPEVHNILSLLWAQALFNNYSEDYPDERLFNLIRSGYAGMQRYATFPWSGDVQKTWNGFQAQLPIMLGMGMSGIGYMGSDLGGFVGELNNELYTRWIQQGVFSPVMRAHGVNVITEPVYFPEPYKSIVRDFIKLRYRMLPYNYTLARINSSTGRPLALPMDYFDPGNPFLSNINDQYFWGEQLLVAPIMEEGQTSRTVIFPQGNWIDFKSDKTYTGEIIHDVSATLDELPVFVKGGSFLPLATPKMSTDYFNTDTLFVWYYPDKQDPNTVFTVYLDDGLTANAYEKGQYELILFDGKVSENQILVDVEKEGNGFSGAPDEHELMFELKRVNNQPLAVLLDDVELPLVDNVFDYYDTRRAAFFNEAKHILMIHFLWEGSPARIEITGTGVGIGETSRKPQNSFFLHNPVPNPFSDEVSLKLDVTCPGNYYFTVYDVYGKMIKNKVILIPEKGRSAIYWNGRNKNGKTVANGTYIVTIQNERGEMAFQKVVLMHL